MRHRARLRRTWLSSIVLFALLLSVRSVAQRLNPPPASKPSKTQVVMLGTGTPGFDIARSGPATAIVVNGTAYLVDFGAGVMRRAEAAYEKGVQALKPTEIHVAFLTHLHVDHTTGYADLIYSPEDQANIRALHTSSVELAEIARRVGSGSCGPYEPVAEIVPNTQPLRSLHSLVAARQFSGSRGDSLRSSPAGPNPCLPASSSVT
jgi:Metallo-beta-lactamase superfamily